MLPVPTDVSGVAATGTDSNVSRTGLFDVLASTAQQHNHCRFSHCSFWCISSVETVTCTFPSHIKMTATEKLKQFASNSHFYFIYCLRVCAYMMTDAFIEKLYADTLFIDAIDKRLVCTHIAQCN